jgi:hypothetical protein
MDNMGKLLPTERDKLSHFLLPITIGMLAPSKQICNRRCTRTPTFVQRWTFWLKYQVLLAIGTARCLRRVTQPLHIARSAFSPAYATNWTIYS